jgi:S-adenosylmethionine:tRNA ribosyltransferase-isomerase
MFISEKDNYYPVINAEDYTYRLPKARIADRPKRERSRSRLLIADAKTGEIVHKHFYDLPDLIPEGALLVVNESKVISARLRMKKSTGAGVELLVVEPYESQDEAQNVLSRCPPVRWKCIVGGRRIETGSVLNSKKIIDNSYVQGKILERDSNEAVVEFSWEPDDLTFADILDKFGSVPLPPYIKRELREEDKKWYQTIYAVKEGSVAAPTAGFHFTEDMIEEITHDCGNKNKKIFFDKIVLHVGPGTFQPIEDGDIRKHKMHGEKISISISTIRNLLGYINSHSDLDSAHTESVQNSNIIATGTTTLRAIESLYWLGCKISTHDCGFNDDLNYDKAGIPLLGQWEAYKYEAENKTLNVKDALKQVLDWLDIRNLQTLTAKTNLFIVPGYKFKIVNGLITNYHIPKSTLLLLVAAFLGEGFWQKVYDEALKNNYRFLSYGDASFLLR